MARIVTQKAITTDYDDIAPVYDRHWAHFNREVRNWVLDRFPHDLPHGAPVLDAGCGTGHVLADIAEEYPHLKLTGIDASAQMLAQAQARIPNATWQQADIAHADLGQGRYKVVMALNVLHHINEPSDFLARLSAACTVGGTIFLCDFAVESVSMRLAEKYWRRFKPSHHRAFGVKEMEAMLRPLPVTIIDKNILRPDIFWRLQIYQLRKTEG